MVLSKSNAPQICLDKEEKIFCWVLKNLHATPDDFGKHITLGIMLSSEPVAGIILHSIRKKRDVWLTVFAENKRWCTKRILRAVFGVCFDLLKCRRVSVRVDAQNFKSIKLIEHLGFVKEGVLRAFENNGHDAVIYSMFNNQCQWRTK